MTDVKDEIIQQLRDQIAFLTSPQIQEHHETMRDRFAMAALTGLLANEGMYSEHWHTYSKHAYALANAMIEARKKETNQ